MVAQIDPMNLKECEKQDEYMMWTFNTLASIAVFVWTVAIFI